MSRYDEFRKMFANDPDEEKLMVIQSESKRLLSRAYGYSLLMNEVIEERKPPKLPDNFGGWCQKVIDSVEELQDLIAALTDWKHRSILREEEARRKRKFGEVLWKSAQHGLPELQDYSGLRDAIEKTADRLGIPLQTPELRIDDSFWRPGGDVNFFGSERCARIGTQASQGYRRYAGYALTLEWLVDERNIKWQEHEGLAPSLEEAVAVLHLWLVEQQALQRIREEYDWMRSGTIQRDV